MGVRKTATFCHAINIQNTSSDKIMFIFLLLETPWDLWIIHPAL